MTEMRQHTKLQFLTVKDGIAEAGTVPPQRLDSVRPFGSCRTPGRIKPLHLLARESPPFAVSIGIKHIVERGQTDYFCHPRDVWWSGLCLKSTCKVLPARCILASMSLGDAAPRMCPPPSPLTRPAPHSAVLQVVKASEIPPSAATTTTDRFACRGAPRSPCKT